MSTGTTASSDLEHSSLAGATINESFAADCDHHTGIFRTMIARGECLDINIMPEGGEISAPGNCLAHVGREPCQGGAD